MSVIQETHLIQRKDSRGSLVAIEGLVDVAFDIKRIYYISGTGTDVRRGCHAHFHLKQMAVCVQGSCRFVLDNGFERVEHLLDNSATGLVIEPMVWHEMYDFSPDCVLLVLADAPYDKADYLHDYGRFIELAQSRAGDVNRLVA